MQCSYPFKQITLKDWNGDKLKWSHPCCNMSRPGWPDPMRFINAHELTPPELFNSYQFDNFYCYHVDQMVFWFILIQIRMG